MAAALRDAAGPAVTACTLVTGASSGLGPCLAQAFARRGLPIVLTARRADELARHAAELRQQYGVRVEVVAVDLADQGGVDSLLAAVRAHGLTVHHLICNAGFGRMGPVASTASEDVAGMVQLNVLAVTMLTRQLLPDIVAARGSILTVASTAAFQPTPLMAVYGATKAYVLSFTEALAEELRGSGVVVTCLCPGPVDTPFALRAGTTKTRLVQGRSLPTAQVVAACAARAMQRGQVVAIQGWINWLLVQSVRFSPRWLVRRIAATVMVER